jgi:hypothetical protein
LWVDHLLHDKVEYVSVKEDLSDLIEVIEWCKSHDDECRQIAENGRKFAEQALYYLYVKDSFAKILWEVNSNISKNDKLYVQEQGPPQPRDMPFTPHSPDMPLPQQQGPPAPHSPDMPPPQKQQRPELAEQKDASILEVVPPPQEESNEGDENTKTLTSGTGEQQKTETNTSETKKITL